MNLIPEVTTALLASADNGYDMDGTGRGTPIIPAIVGALNSQVGERGHGGAGLCSSQSVAAGHVIPIAHSLSSEGADASEDGTGRGVPLVVGGGSYPTVTEGSPPLTGRRADQTAVAIAFRGREGGIAAELGDEVANAVRSGAGSASRGGHVFTQAVRRLTPTECERLQGFPDGWTAGHSDSGRYRMLGNAVCVPVAEWMGQRMVAYHTSTVEAGATG